VVIVLASLIDDHYEGRGDYLKQQFVDFVATYTFVTGICAFLFGSNTIRSFGVTFLLFSSCGAVEQFASRWGFLQTRFDRIIFRLALIIAVIAAGDGHFTALRDLRRKDVRFSLINSEGARQGSVLRQTEKGVLFREPEASTVTFVPWDDVKRLSRLKAPNDGSSVASQSWAFLRKSIGK
jgi:hypothetical protein